MELAWDPEPHPRGMPVAPPTAELSHNSPAVSSPPLPYGRHAPQATTRFREAPCVPPDFLAQSRCFYPSVFLLSPPSMPRPVRASGSAPAWVSAPSAARVAVAT